jgi:hypothetical protein
VRSLAVDADAERMKPHHPLKPVADEDAEKRKARRQVVEEDAEKRKARRPVVEEDAALKFPHAAAAVV